MAASVYLALAVEMGEPGCNEDIWTCSTWSDCQPDGTQTRQCTMEVLCPNADNDRPLEEQYCEYETPLSAQLECSNEETARDRIRCRTYLDNKYSDGKIIYLPEECHFIYDSGSKDECIRKYSLMQSCATKDSLHECLAESLNLQDISRRISDCGNPSCILKAENDVYSYSKLQIYSLISRSESMLEAGWITEDQAIDIIYVLEQKILAFNNAQEKQDRISILHDAKDTWMNFIQSLKEAE
jgi:hypothetical protein